MNRVKIPRWYWAVWALVVVGLVVGTGVVVRSTREQVRAERLTAARGRVETVEHLVTTSFRYRDVVYFDREARILGIPAGQQELLFSVEMDVRAGIDLAEGFSVEPDAASPDAVFVTLPAARVLQIDADEDSIRQYFVRERLQTLDWLDIADEVEAAKRRNREDAVERGILRRAERQAARLLETMLREIGFERVDVRFRRRDGELVG